MGMWLTGLKLLSIGMMTFGAMKYQCGYVPVFLPLQERLGSMDLCRGLFDFCRDMARGYFHGRRFGKQDLEHNLEFKMQQKLSEQDTQLALMYKFNF